MDHDKIIWRKRNSQLAFCSLNLKPPSNVADLSGKRINRLPDKYFSHLCGLLSRQQLLYFPVSFWEPCEQLIFCFQKPQRWARREYNYIKSSHTIQSQLIILFLFFQTQTICSATLSKIFLAHRNIQYAIRSQYKHFKQYNLRSIKMP